MSNLEMGLNEILGRSITQWTQGQHHVQTPIAGLSLSRWEHLTEPTSYVMDCQSVPDCPRTKTGHARSGNHTYDASHFLFTAVDFPVIAQITEASPERPYLSVLLKLDPHFYWRKSCLKRRFLLNLHIKTVKALRLESSHPI